MAEGADDVRYDMVMTRQRMADTLAEIEARVSTTVGDVKSKLDVMRLVREHPWPALAIALAAGYTLAATGADGAAASAVAEGTVGAAQATKEAAAGVADRIRERIAGDGEPSAPEPEEPSWLDRIGARVAAEISELLGGPSAELSHELARAGGRERGEPTFTPIDPEPLGSAGELRL